MYYHVNQLKLLLLLISIFQTLLITFTSSHTIAIDVETSEIINSPDSKIAESTPKLNDSINKLVDVISLHPIPNDCIFFKTEEGVYSFQSEGGSSRTCGLYLLAQPEYNIEIEFLNFDVTCTRKGLLSVIDAWELNGQYFPSIDDHPLPHNARHHEFCGPIKPSHVFKMSQNVGMLAYRIPTAGEGFVLRVRFVENPKPCNVIIQDPIGIYTIRNFGRQINCTASLLYEISFQILSMNIGQSYRPLGNLVSLPNYVVETGIIKKCKKRGMQDYMELRGGTGLDPNHMMLAEDMCGLRSFSLKKKFTVSCPNTAVRLVSSGNYDNLIEFAFKSFEQNLAASLVCPI